MSCLQFIMFRSHLSPRKTPSKKDISPINIRLNGHYPECSSVAMGGGSSLPIGLKSTQNRTFLVLLRSIFAQKMKTAPPKGFGSRSCGGLADIRPKIRLNFGENLFFGRSPVFERKNRLNSDFGWETRLNFSEDLFFLEITCF